MGDLFLLFIVGSAIWVFFDAKSIGVKKGQLTGLVNLSPLGWFFVTLLLWIIGFPAYIANRRKLKEINSVKAHISSNDR